MWDSIWISAHPATLREGKYGKRAREFALRAIDEPAELAYAIGANPVRVW